MTASAHIFDMDGALLSLEVDIEEVRLRLAALFAPYGVTRPFRPILGRVPAAAREAAARGGDPAALVRAGLAIVEAEEVRGAASARAAVGAAEALAELAAAGVPLGLTTHCARAAVAPALVAAGLDQRWFAGVVSRDDAALEPAHGRLLVALEKLSRPEDEAWYVGSHAHDVEVGRAARASGWPALRLAAVGSSPSLRAAGADRVLGSLRELAPGR